MTTLALPNSRVLSSTVGTKNSTFNYGKTDPTSFVSCTIPNEFHLKLDVESDFTRHLIGIYEKM